MDPPPVQYVTTKDGYNIAYAVSGEGMPVIFMQGIFEHVQLGWQFPGQQPWLEGLAAKFRLIQYDPRGAGMSARGLKDTHVRRDYQLDLDALVDRLKLERFLIVAMAHGVARALEYAARFPDRVIGLVLGTSGTPRSPALFQLVAAQDWDGYLYSVYSRAGPPEEVEKQVRLTKEAYDHNDALLKTRANLEDGVDELLRTLHTPMLILHARDYAPTPVEEGMKKAQLSGAPLVVLDGYSAYGDADQGIRAIESFVAGLTPDDSPPASAQSVLSSREVEVLRLIASGKSNQQIADELVLSVNTVARHVANILSKTGAANRTEAAAYAREKNLI
ncbi:MAG TPA: alpha/beta fold hydrolase [Dehalococcoidia bacterium]|nr:alpha/beta fold hydrolase [Dehalococcoidia bacterium]